MADHHLARAACSGRTVRIGTADLSAQPSGTSLRLRARTLNAKEQRLHGVWIQWR